MDVNAADWVGWASSLVLMLTLVSQMVRQQRERTLAGVSRWLFAGQMAASAGFVAYSAMVGNAVFIVTNAVLLVLAMVGQILFWRQQHRA